MVNITPASPCIATTGTFGRATFAPIAEGRANPNVPNPEGTNQVLGRYVFFESLVMMTTFVLDSNFPFFVAKNA